MTDEKTAADAVAPDGDAAATPAAVAMFDLESIQDHANWERNGDLPSKGGHDDRCLLCNRPLTGGAKAMVHMSNGNELFPASYNNWEDPESQGCFSVGAGCVRKVPAAYRLSGAP